MGKVIIISAPSGSGKTTIVNRLLEKYPMLEFSISATSRAPRGIEVNGREYYFYTNDEFQQMVADDKFLEWEEVYAGTCYGTLKSEVERIWSKNNIVIFDVDVVGGVNIKRIFGEDALSIFIQPPSIDALRERLEYRATDSKEAIDRRVAKAEKELKYAPMFDHLVINDILDDAVRETDMIISKFING